MHSFELEDRPKTAKDSSHADSSHETQISVALSNEEEKSVWEADAPDAPPRPNIGRMRLIMIFIGLAGAVFLFSLDNTIVTNLVAVMLRDFDATDLISWLSAGYTIGCLALCLTYGKLYAVLNTKWLYLIADFLFIAATALCGAAPNIEVEIVARVLAGVGGSGVYMGTLILIIAVTSEEDRGTYMASIGIGFGIGTVIGPIVGGGFAEFDWRWAFYLVTILGAVCLGFCLICVPSVDPKPGQKFMQRMSSFDALGSFLFVGAVIFLLMGVGLGGTLYSWSSGYIIAFFVVSAAMFIIFGVQQGFCLLTTQENRIFPVHFLRNRHAILLFICAAAGNCATFVPIYYLPIYFQGDSAMESAIRLLPLICILTASLMASGPLIHKFRPFQEWFLFGSALVVVAGALLAGTIEVDTPPANIYGYQVLLGVGAGLFMQAGYDILLIFVEEKDRSYGVAYMSLAQQTGIGLGVSMAGTIFINTAVTKLRVLLPDAPRIELVDLVSGVNADFLAQLTTEERGLVLRAVVHAMRNAFMLQCVGAAVVFVMSLGFKRINVGKALGGKGGGVTIAA